MTEAVLSREELDALLASVAESGKRVSSRPFLGRDGAPRPARLTGLLRHLEDFAAEQSRALSTLFQSPIRFSLSAWEELAPNELLPALDEHDRLARFALEPGGHSAALILGRSLFFGWMALAFGARPASLSTMPPDRPYTRIEERFMRRIAKELGVQLERSLAPEHEATTRFEGLAETPELLERGTGSDLVASFDVRGLGELSRMRWVLPLAAFEGVAAAALPSGLPAAGQARSVLLEAALQARVQVGATELPLARIARLRPGDVIPLEVVDPEGLVVEIEGRPKFRAERGAVGGRLAVRITETLEAGA